jgi:hypothetical protein
MERDEMLELIDPTLEDAEIPALPLPEVVDTPAIVLAAMLAGGTRPLVLDGARVREIQPSAADMLVALLRAKRDADVDARITGASAALCRRMGAHPIAAFFAASATYGAESLFICPDREDLGFSPSMR